MGIERSRRRIVATAAFVALAAAGPAMPAARAEVCPTVASDVATTNVCIYEYGTAVPVVTPTDVQTETWAVDFAVRLYNFRVFGIKVTLPCAEAQYGVTPTYVNPCEDFGGDPHTTYYCPFGVCLASGDPHYVVVPQAAAPQNEVIGYLVTARLSVTVLGGGVTGVPIVLFCPTPSCF